MKPRLRWCRYTQKWHLRPDQAGLAAFNHYVFQVQIYKARLDDFRRKLERFQ